MTRLLLTGLLSLTTLIGIAGTNALQAKEPTTGPDHRERDHYRRYAVYYRCGPREPWQFYGSYASHREAHRAERRLERQGHEAIVREGRYRH
jgi:hypothetical protein